MLPVPAEDLLPVPTEAKPLIGGSRVDLSTAWHGEEVVWVGDEEAPFAITYNQASTGPCTPCALLLLVLPAS